MRLASAKFGDLTHCEQEMLLDADATTTAHTPWGSSCGPNPKFEDPSNDPANAAKWDHQREIRADLIRWIFVDRNAAQLIDPVGVRAMGARVVGKLDMVDVRQPFGLWLVRSEIPEIMSFDFADLLALVFTGSHTAGISAPGVHLHNGAYLDQGFQSSAQVFFGNSRIDSDFTCVGGHFNHDPKPGGAPWDSEKPALFLGVARVQGPIWLSYGFSANGAVDINGVTCAASVFCTGGTFSNPGNNALNATNANVAGWVSLASQDKWGGMIADGMVHFETATIGGVFLADGAKFLGRPDESHGLSATSMDLKGVFLWTNITLENGAILDLRGSSSNGVFDDQGSWPLAGHLGLDGYSYRDFYGGPTDARSRLRWVGLASGPRPSWFKVPAGFHPQPYRELANVLRERGDDAGATTVLIAEEDARYSQYGTLGRSWGRFLRYTIGYGHRPLLAVFWSFVVVVAGWIVVAIAKRAGVMRLTWPETTPPPGGDTITSLHPLLYSLDVFLPFVDLHQEHYWWPDDAATGNCSILGYRFRVHGAVLRYYLWLQIIAGWLLSAIFIAGVTGLLRND
jgi:hypothetical protein